MVNTVQQQPPPPKISILPNLWVILPIVAVVVVILSANLLLLNYIHVFTASIYFEMRKSEPDMSRIQRLMRMYVKVVAIQAAMQFVIIFIMAEFATGFFLKL